MSIVAEMLNEIVARAVTAVSQANRGATRSPSANAASVRRSGSIELIAIGASIDAEAHWRAHMDAVGKVMIGHEAKTVIDLLDHY